MYDDILVPVDGSDGTADVLAHVADIARWANATVHVLYVADTARDSVTVVESGTVDVLVGKGEDVVAAATDELAGRGVECDSDVVQGNPAPSIADYATEYGHDLIVMATHGREGLSRFLESSVTEKVVRLADVPVLTARRREDEVLAFPYEDVLLPVDGSDGATRAARHGLDLAAALDATAHVLAVADDESLGPDVRSVLSERDLEARAGDAIEEVTAMADERGVSDVVEHIAHGDPTDEVRTAVETTGADVVVMGTTGRRGVDRILLGSVAEATLRSAPVPVVTVGEN